MMGGGKHKRNKNRHKNRNSSKVNSSVSFEFVYLFIFVLTQDSISRYSSIFMLGSWGLGKNSVKFVTFVSLKFRAMKAVTNQIFYKLDR